MEQTYWPVFFLTKEPVPDDYFDAFDTTAQEHHQLPWMNISTMEPKKAFEKKYVDNRPLHTSLRPYTIEEAYDYYKSHLRPKPDTRTETQHFTTFSFLAVDEECTRTRPRECILCSDSPDLHERDSEILLKQLRMPIEKAMSLLCAIEQLSITMSEIDNPSQTALISIPSVLLMPIRTSNFYYVLATPAEARANKRSAMEFDPGVGERVMHPERRAVVRRLPIREVKATAWSERERFALARRMRTMVSHPDINAVFDA